jgi:NitT/TauT family transport system ATP-binding protein
MADAILSIRGVTRDFFSRGKLVTALGGVDLEIPEGEFLTIVGPSGCGKSTLLNLISGLMPPSGGAIWYRGHEVRGVNTEIGYITQQDNLYPWRTLRDNVAFPLEIQRVPAEERRRRAAALIAKVGLAGFEDHYPYELSGGMRQRANIIRTLIYDPQLILMDEPFGPLDAQTRVILQDQLLKLWLESRKTVVFITHDLVEAIALADRVAVMTARPGVIKSVNEVTISRPRDIFHIHDNEAFRRLYDKLWEELEVEVRRGSGGWLETR